MEESKAVIETRLTHELHRRATTLLADAAVRPSAPLAVLADFRAFLVATLRHHHEMEDDVLWPLITASAPAVAEPLRALSAEHAELDAALDQLAGAAVQTDKSRGALQGAATRVQDIITVHLSHEEPLLFPALRAHVTPIQWETFAAQVIATSPMEGAHFMVGLYDQVGTPEEVDLVLSGLPAPAIAALPALRKQGRAELQSLQAAA